MRKMYAGLIAALLSAAPAVVIAGPDKDTKSSDPWGHTQTFEWTSSSEGARLGVMVMSLTDDLRTYFGAPSNEGVLVAKVEPGSPAAKAGIKVGDVLVQVKGEKVGDASDVIQALSDAKQGEKVKLSVVRDHKQIALDAAIGTSHPSNALMTPEWFHRAFPWFDDWPSMENHRSKST